MERKLIIIRHGESLGNIENKFTGWLDVDLTTHGCFKAYKAGLKIKKNNINIDICYTSLLKRAIKTSFIVLEGCNKLNAKIVKSKYLNERHYGGISGTRKVDSEKEYSEDKVNSWLDILSPNYPPRLNKNDVRYNYSKLNYKKYKNLTSTESLRSVFNRIIKFWKINLLPKIKLNKNILIVSHSNSLKILISYLTRDYEEKNILPNNTPMLMYLDENYKCLEYYLL